MRTRTVLNKMRTLWGIGAILIVGLGNSLFLAAHGKTLQGESSFGGNAAGIIHDLVTWQGSIFLGAENGLIQLTGKTVSIYDQSNSPLGAGFISDLEVDQNGNIWISEYGGGLFVLDQQLGQVRQILPQVNLLRNISSTRKKGDLLVIGLVGGIAIYDLPSNDIVQKITHLNEEQIVGSVALAVIDDTHVAFAAGNKIASIDLSSFAVNSNFLDNAYPALSRITALRADDQKIYVGGDEGIYEIKLSKTAGSKFYSMQHNNARGFDVSRIFIDSEGRVLVAAGGFYMLDETNRKIVTPDWFNPVLTSSSIETVTSISETSSGDLLVASSQLGLVTVPSLGYGLNMLNDGKTFFQENIKGLIALQEGNIGVISDEAIYHLDPATGEANPIAPGAGTVNKDELNYSQVLCLNPIFMGSELTKEVAEDFEALCQSPSSFSIPYLDSGHLIYSNSGNRGHFFVTDNKNNLIDSFVAPRHTVGAFYSSTGELYSFNNSGDIFVQNSKISWRKLNKNPLKGSVITCSVEIDSHSILFCSSGKGLIEYNSDSGKFAASKILVKERPRYIRSAIKDKQAHLWIATNKGLFLYNSEHKTSEKITSLEGIYDLDFEYYGLKSLGDRLFIIGDRYSYILNTAEIHHILGKQASRTSLTKITSFTDESGSSAESPAGVPIPPTAQTISLPFLGNSFTINVSSTDFTRHEVQEVTYRLTGHAEEWNTSDSSQASINYSSLPIGDYEFQARVVDPRSQAEQPITALKIRVLPPFWLTWQAFVCYSFLLVLLLVHFYKKYRQQLALHGSQLSGMVTEKQDALEDSNTSIRRLLQRKQTLFTNVSHELRTPLSLIVGPLEQIKEDPSSPENGRRIDIISRNAERLGRLVNQLLEIEQLEAIKESPRQEYVIEKAVPLIVSSVEPLAEYKHHNFTFKLRGAGSIRLLADSLEQIIGNLVSNAVKYTPEGGAVSVLVRCDDLHLIVEVADTGSGMSEEEVKIIFNRFTRLQKEEDKEGSGVGLALIKELIVANGGWISVNSKPGEGSVFTVHLPMFEVESPVVSSLEPLLWEEKIENEDNDEFSAADSDTTKPIILIVEDNNEMRGFLSEVLRAKYNCLTAKDGKEALQTANAVMPSLILTDYMMPRMDGLQFAKAIRDQELTAHIPIILLTARGDSDTRKKSLSTHVDYCLTKPVNKSELVLRIENLLELRKRAAEGLRENLVNRDPEADIEAALPEFANEKDQSFYVRFLCTIEKHYGEETFSRQLAAKEMAVSERQLNRKLAMLFEHNFTEYLKQYRLQKSKPLLRSGRQITQVAYDVGFSSPGYFSNCFKQAFGTTPTQFQEGVAVNRKEA